jgi:hypothetical protein
MSDTFQQWALSTSQGKVPVLLTGAEQFPFLASLLQEEQLYIISHEVTSLFYWFPF